MVRAPALVYWLLLAGCRLVAPFDLGALADGDADVDAELDADAEERDGALADGDAEGDSDRPSWAPLVGCTGAPSPAERWLVLVNETDHVATYLTHRDCASPELLCSDCYGTSISPDGSRALVLQALGDGWRLDDEIGLVDLEGPTPAVTWLGLSGASPVWVDDASFVYVAKGALTEAPCVDGGSLEATLLRRHVVDTGEDHAVGGHVPRAWWGGFPAPSALRRRVAFPVDLGPICQNAFVAVNVRDLDGSHGAAIDWTTSNEKCFPVGLLPGGEGFLVQRVDRWPALTSSVYAVSFGGEAEVLLVGIQMRFDSTLVGPYGNGMWPDCGASRRLGPACELYCRENGTTAWYRYSLTDAEAEPQRVACTGFGDDYRIMDIRQP